MFKSLTGTRLAFSSPPTTSSLLLRLPRSFPRPLRTLTTAARPIGTFTERRPDRPLPDPTKNPTKTLLTIPLFASILLLAAAGIFNYQKSSSSVVSSTLYALRVHPAARELLGEDISFKSRVPWIQGTMNQLRGDIDITYGVKGTKGEGVMHFRSVRRERMGLFETLDWSLVMRDGHKIVLLDNSAADPYPQAAVTPA
ncbi:cytochrome oxidase complex assembly protein 1-domain-containing protein [Tuber borchii]|uniref:Cytochrome oxidase complex assembly protein 1-domain-containing protein n=1 Tax=Tuber borchii TaxID=42251 RepID=A0A2T6ZBH9_TUBBO|nr:cytochrome oxidase complex assembly protein 1-domain-containing protein [Tuber borchii]